MDQHEWGLFRETVGHGTQANMLGVDTEDATHDELLAAIGRPQHPQHSVPSPVTAGRRRVDLIRQRVRNPDTAGEPAPPGPGAEDSAAARGELTWVAAPLTELPHTTREVVGPTGSPIDPDAAGRNLSPARRTLRSRCARSRCARRRMRRQKRHPGSAVCTAEHPPPMRAALGVVLSHPVVTSTALAVTLPVVIAALVLLPLSEPGREHADTVGPPVALPLPTTVLPEPRSGGSATPELLPGTDSSGSGADLTTPESEQSPAGLDGPALGAGDPARRASPRPPGDTRESPSTSGSSDSGPSASGPSDSVRSGSEPSGSEPSGGSPPSDPAPSPEGRTAPAPECAPEVPVIGHIGCAIDGLFGQITGGFVGARAPLSLSDPVGGVPLSVSSSAG